MKATMLWFVDEGAITHEDYEVFLRLKNLRNSFAHEMTKHIWDGLYEEHAKAIGQLMNLYRKIEKWWINEVEIPISGEILPNEYDKEGVTSGALITFEMMFNTLYADKSDKYLKMIHDLRQAGEEK